MRLTSTSRIEKSRMLTPDRHPKIARRNTPSKEVAEYAQSLAEDGEIEEIDMLPLDLDRCVAVIVSGMHPSACTGKPHRVASWSRIGLLYASLRRFGFSAVQDRLAAL
jgi:hypothetical protein